jgi:branched-chain amino acid transport system permease protein
VVATVEVFGSYVIGTAWKEVLYLVLFIAILIVRPAGLFGQRGAEALGM